VKNSDSFNLKPATSYQPPANSHVLLSMRQVTKCFGATIALQEADFEVRSGEVHALIGENGAGKSTLVKVLAGVFPPDAGEMILDGRSYRPATPAKAQDRGIAMIYQERNLAPDLSVEANIMLGLEPTNRLGFLKKDHIRQQVGQAKAALNHTDIPLDIPVRRLGAGQQQLVEIAKTLVTDARLIVFDEPTSSLSSKDAEQLFSTITRLKEKGLGIIYISHFLEEIKAISDCYTILRDGRTVKTGQTAAADLSSLITGMTGRPVETLYPRIPHDIGPPVLKLHGLTGRRLPANVDLELWRGEIMGLFWLVGAGRTELLRALYGLDPIKTGRVTIGTLQGPAPMPNDRIRQGLGMLSEDRHHEGLAQDQSIEDNMMYGRMAPFTRYGLLGRREMKKRVNNWVKKMHIRVRDIGRPVRHLSGGNQQKVAMARLLHWDVDILLLDEPTRGIDIASKTVMYQLIGELAAQGKTVLFVSSYLSELLGVCDRISVMHRGILSPPMDTDGLDEHRVMSIATGVG